MHVHFMSDLSKGHGERPMSWRNPKINFPHTYWNDYGIKNHHFNPGMLWHLYRSKPDYLLVSSPFDTFTGICASLFLKKGKRCAWTEGNVKTTGKMNGFVGWFKRLVFSQYEYIAVPGQQGKKYIELHQQHTRRKMPQCVFLPNLVDERRFMPREEWPATDIAPVRRSLEVNDSQKLCLLPIRLEWYKGGLAFLKALPPKNALKGWRIVIMGEGSEKTEMLKEIADRDLEDIVSILNFVPYDKMPLYYAAADLFILPSFQDRNPLSVIEALHSGLPVAVSDRAGNVDEAVTPRKNGWVLPVSEYDCYAQILAEIFNTPIDTLKDMGHSSKQNNALFWDSERSVSVFCDSILN